MHGSQYTTLTVDVDVNDVTNGDVHLSLTDGRRPNVFVVLNIFNITRYQNKDLGYKIMSSFISIHESFNYTCITYVYIYEVINNFP